MRLSPRSNHRKVFIFLVLTLAIYILHFIFSGDLANLYPRLSIVQKIDAGDGSYPSVNTCVHYLNLPDYAQKYSLMDRSRHRHQFFGQLSKEDKGLPNIGTSQLMLIYFNFQAVWPTSILVWPLSEKLMPVTAPILQWILVCITWNSQTILQKRLWGKNFWLPPVKKDSILTNNLHNLYLLYVIILKNRIQKYKRNREKTEIKPQRICNSILFLSIHS